MRGSQNFVHTHIVETVLNALALSDLLAFLIIYTTISNL